MLVGGPFHPIEPFGGSGIRLLQNGSSPTGPARRIEIRSNAEHEPDEPGHVPLGRDLVPLGPLDPVSDSPVHSILTRLRLWWKWRKGIPVYSFGRKRGYIKVYHSKGVKK